jgi:hypothetical protein
MSLWLTGDVIKVLVDRELAIEPGSRDGPQAIRGPARDAQGVRGFLVLEAGEVAQLHKLRCLGVMLFQLGESFVHGQELIGFVGRTRQLFIEGDPLGSTPMFHRGPLSRPFDQDAPHGFRRSSKEVATILPVRLVGPLLRRGGQQTQIGFMDKCRGVERLPRLFSRQLLGRQGAQFAVEMEQKFVACSCLPLPRRIQDLTELIHTVRKYRPE